MENRDVSELKGEKEDLEKKLREKEEMEQKYHDLLNSLKYVIQSGTTQQKETIPQVKIINKQNKGENYSCISLVIWRVEALHKFFFFTVQRPCQKNKLHKIVISENWCSVHLYYSNKKRLLQFIFVKTLIKF